MVLIGIIQYARQRAHIARSIKAEGTVIELIRQREEGKYIRLKTKSGIKLENKYLYRPAIEFTTRDKRTIRFNANIASRPAPYQLGDKVTVIYLPGNPTEAQIASFIHLWFHALILISFGLFFAVMGILGLLLT